MLGLFAGSLLAGLMGTPHCVGMCGGFAVAAGDRPGGWLWHVGKLVAYMGLGALAGAFGQILPGPGWLITGLSVGLLGWSALRLGGVPLPSWSPRWAGLTSLATRFARRADPLGAFVFGLTTGLLPCGLLYTALAFPIGARDPLLGALLMGVFALGTLPALAAARAGLRWVHRQGLLTRRLVAILVFVLGLSALLTRSGGLLSGQAAAPGAPPPCHTPA